MNNKLTIYYLILLSFIGVKLIGTIYQGSLLVFHSRSSHKLSEQKNKLEDQKLSLNLKLAEQQSLTQISQSDQIKQFELVTKPVTINSIVTVAANSN